MMVYTAERWPGGLSLLHSPRERGISGLVYMVSVVSLERVVTGSYG